MARKKFAAVHHQKYTFGSRKRQEGEGAANFPSMTLKEFNGWMQTGIPLTSTPRKCKPISDTHNPGSAARLQKYIGTDI